jgi:NADPH:quinone reductase-like Zn-dependent oxidoreductase
VGRNVGVQGFYLGRLMARRVDVVAAAARELLDLWAAGAIKPIVGAEFPLAEAPDAHRLIEERKHVGKVVLLVEAHHGPKP